MSEETPSGLAGSSTSAPKKRKLASSGRKERPCWDSFEKIELPEERARSLGRNFDGKCLACGSVVTGKPKDLNRHLSECKELAPGDQITALMAAATQAGVTAETGHLASGSATKPSESTKKSSRSPIKKYLDRATIGPAEMRRLQLLLCLAFVMCGWSFRTVESPFFVGFCQSLRPKFECPSKCNHLLHVCKILPTDSHQRMFTAGAWLLRNTLLDALAYQVMAQQAKWMQDDSVAYHLTLSLDGWSNSRMESIYFWNIVFPDRRVMLLRSDDVSSMSHTGANLAGPHA